MDKESGNKKSETKLGAVLNIQFFNLHDGTGVRTVVFLKGCPLKCRWCSNPETINSIPELGLNRILCNECGKCLDVCPENALTSDDEGVIQIDRDKCNICGECVTVCLPEALTVYGKKMTAQEVFKEVSRDKMFYDGTGGGVTISGGEPLNQPRFLSAVLELCRKDGIHTCVETSGFAKPKVLEKVLPFVDSILFDLKHMNSQTHKELTGQYNEIILSNAMKVTDSDTWVLFRIPLIPGLNDSPENIQQTALFVNGLQKENVQGIELMPYHRIGAGKYETLDRSYLLNGLTPPDAIYVELVRKQFEDFGLKCTVSR